MQHDGQGHPPFFCVNPERAHEGNRDLDFFVIRDNDSVGLGNGNSGQIMLLAESSKIVVRVNGSEVCVYEALVS